MEIFASSPVAQKGDTILQKGDTQKGDTILFVASNRRSITRAKGTTKSIVSPFWKYCVPFLGCWGGQLVGDTATRALTLPL